MAGSPGMDPSGLGGCYNYHCIYALGRSRSDVHEKLCSVTASACQAGFAPSTSRHADLIVDSDLLKTSLLIKHVDVSVNTSYMMFM